MNLLDENSLAATLNGLNRAWLRGDKLAPAEREEIAHWLASRVGVPGSYRGLPAPTPADYRGKIHLFTGETVGSRAGTGCKLGFEAVWALAVLRSRQRATVAAAESCRQRVIGLFGYDKTRRGMYCCGSCSTAGWRVLGVAGTKEARELLNAGVARLRARRDGRGRWNSFPFWYTVLALNDLNQPCAVEELRYARPALERALRREPAGNVYQQRRRLLVERALARI